MGGVILLGKNGYYFLMVRLKVKNFGPIRDGYPGDGFFDINRLTVFVGSQGEGKSTLAKLVSTFSYIEKQVARQYSIPDESSLDEMFRNSLSYFNLTHYLKQDSFISYHGPFLLMTFSNGRMTAKNSGGAYSMPKMAYIPADRNLCASEANIFKISGLSDSLSEMVSEFIDANRALANGGFPIPFEGISYRYEEKSDRFMVDGPRYSLELHECASGYKSAIPMLLIAWYCNSLASQKLDVRIDRSSYNTRKAIRGMFDEQIGHRFDISAIMDHVGKNKDYADLYDKVTHFSSNTSCMQENGVVYSYGNMDISLAFDGFVASLRGMVDSSFFAIIEEPEQNLFPEYQMDVMESLLSLNNSNTDNMMLVTTHSPFILETINNLILAGEIRRIGRVGVEKLVKSSAMLSYDTVSAYSISNGNIERIMDDELRQIAAISIDRCSEKISETYSKLIDLEFDGDAE